MSITLSNCIESIENPAGRFRTLKNIYPAGDGNGTVIMRADDRSAGFKTVVDGEEFMLRCLLAHDKTCTSRLKEISSFTKLIGSDRLTDFLLLEDEMLVFDNSDKPRYLNVTLQKIPVGTRLDEYMGRLTTDGKSEAVRELIGNMAGMGRWMAANGFSHGRINSKNIWVTQSLGPVLFDYINASRKNPSEDIEALAVLAAGIYTAHCRPDCYHAMNRIYETSGPPARMNARSAITILAGLLGREIPGELSTLFGKMGSDTKKPDTNALCDMIEALASCEMPPSPRKNPGYGVTAGGKTLTAHERLMKYSYIGEINDMLMRAFDGHAWCYLDKQGEVAIDGCFLYASDFYEGRAVVETESGYGVIDREGNYVMEPGYDDIAMDQPSNLFIVTLEGRSGLYSREGEIVAGLVFDQILNSSEGLFPVKLNKRFGYMRHDGSMAVDPIYDDAFGFRDGAARVRIRNREMLIDRHGKKIDEVPRKRSAVKTI